MRACTFDRRIARARFLFQFTKLSHQLVLYRLRHAKAFDRGNAARARGRKLNTSKKACISNNISVGKSLSCHSLTLLLGLKMDYIKRDGSFLIVIDQNMKRVLAGFVKFNAIKHHDLVA